MASTKELELEFKRISNDLQFSFHKLEQLFAREHEDGSTPDLYKLVTRIRKLQKDVPQLQKSQKEQNERYAVSRQKLSKIALANHGCMLQLYQSLGCDPSDCQLMQCQTEEIVQALTSKGLAEPNDRSSMRLPATRERSGGAPEPDSVVQHRAPASNDHSADASPAVKRIIFEEEFSAIPVSIRGRSKLEDVQKLYTWLIERNKGSHGRVVSVSKQELDSAGLKVFGHTGDCILATLKALGCVKIGKSGSVSLCVTPVALYA